MILALGGRGLPCMFGEAFSFEPAVFGPGDSRPPGALRSAQTGSREPDIFPWSLRTTTTLPGCSSAVSRDFECRLDPPCVRSSMTAIPRGFVD